jgi:uncharacterized iron-regulated membrane protein
MKVEQKQLLTAMKTKKLRNFSFFLHRYIGLFVGAILVIVGITGSILVFYPELENYMLTRQVGQIEATGDRLPMQTILDNVKSAYRERQDLKFDNITPSQSPDIVQVGFTDKKDIWTEVNVNPYTGEIINSRVWNTSFFGRVFELHYALLAGETGVIVVGIAALLMFILSVTGLVLWPGWRKLIAGFKVKWNARPKRVNFDLHKLVGIISVVFLAAIAFTGFCWNFSAQTYPVIHAVTLTPQPIDPTSTVTGKSPMDLDEILRRADAALPEATTTYVSLPTEPKGVFNVGKRLPQDKDKWGSSHVYLEQYTGEVLKVTDSRSLSRGDMVLNSFTPMHYGTFGGLPTRIFYVFIGLTPLILFVTSLVMYRYRYRPHGLERQTTALADSAYRQTPR